MDATSLLTETESQMKALQQNKEDLEKCIKEQGSMNEVSVPKTDDLVDEVNSKSINGVTGFSDFCTPRRKLCSSDQG